MQGRNFGKFTRRGLDAVVFAAGRRSDGVMPESSAYAAPKPQEMAAGGGGRMVERKNLAFASCIANVSQVSGKLQTDKRKLKGSFNWQLSIKALAGGQATFSLNREICARIIPAAVSG
jgi:hypothetical protein